MKKVIYVITRLGKSETKLKGVGFIADTDLLIASKTQEGKPYIRVFEDCMKYCHQVINTTDEYKGSYYELFEYDGRQVEANYLIWLKCV